MSETLNSLADRVEQGTGPDRELDYRIAMALKAPHFSYTESIDAVEALRTQLLPGSFVVIDQFMAGRWHGGVHGADEAHWSHGYAAGEPRARLAALLRAIGGQNV